MEMEDYESLIGENNVLDEYMREFQENDTLPTRQKRMKRGRCCIILFVEECSCGLGLASHLDFPQPHHRYPDQ